MRAALLPAGMSLADHKPTMPDVKEDGEDGLESLCYHQLAPFGRSHVAGLLGEKNQCCLGGLLAEPACANN